MRAGHVGASVHEVPRTIDPDLPKEHKANSFWETGPEKILRYLASERYRSLRSVTFTSLSSPSSTSPDRGGHFKTAPQWGLTGDGSGREFLP